MGATHGLSSPAQLSSPYREYGLEAVQQADVPGDALTAPLGHKALTAAGKREGALRLDHAVPVP